MKTRTVTIDELRDIVVKSGYRALSRDTGVNHATLIRFSGGSPVQTDTLQKIVKKLGLRVVID